MQVVGYAPRVDEHAALLLSDADVDGVERVPLDPGTSISYALDDRHCAGTLHDGSHTPCDESSAPYCDVHTDRWPCARCTGECDLPLESCEEEHAIYLAAFAPDTFKVGVTRTWRLETRLREQGADRAAHLRTVVNGRVARQVEADLARDLTDRVRTPTKIDGLHQTVNEAAWAAVLEAHDHIETFDFEDDLGLTERPQQETLASGNVVGTKGRIAVLSNAGSTYAVDLRDLVGFEVSDGSPDRDIQSSLGAF